MINRHRNHWLPLLTLLLLGWSASAWAQPSILVVLEQETALFGEAVPLQIVAVAEGGTTIDAFDYRALENQDNMEVLDAKRLDKAGEGNRSISTLDLKLIFWEEGRYTIPPVTLTYTTNGQQEQIQSDNASILIRTMDVASDTTRLMPIKDIIEEPMTLRDYAPYLVGIAALLIIGLLIYFFRQNRKAASAPPKPPRRTTLRALMMERLSALEAEKRWQQGDIKGYHSELTYQARFYLERRYGIRALESTTDTIVQHLEGHALSDEQVQTLRRLLQTADLVKFAKAEPEVTIHEEAMQRLRQFIRDTDNPRLMAAIYESGTIETYEKAEDDKEAS
ncbi:hypothetical protein [Phaeodactylibacter xiamenensis]|uniref:hypothetical protein n=1 Tax=Phaeodactylibacter xiamenensis TaxID=1524460 RepID=UPI0024A8AD20|nr:hypothetical protein [Phaeodactylibacter xiamenensis]